jgi:hypothetical protein
MATFYERPDQGWTAIPTELIRATELGPVARLVLMHALSHRSDWEDTSWRMAEALGVSRERVIKALNELKKTGHARKTSVITVPGRPPRQGWDFAWPAFVEGTSPKSENPTMAQSASSRPKSENPTMASDTAAPPKSDFPTLATSPQVSTKVGFSEDGFSQLWRFPTMAEPTMGNPSSENPTPLLDLPITETGVLQNKTDSQNKTDPPTPQPEADPEPRPILYNFDDDDPVMPPSATRSKSTPRTKPSTPRRPRTSYEYTPGRPGPRNEPADDPGRDPALPGLVQRAPVRPAHAALAA